MNEAKHTPGPWSYDCEMGFVLSEARDIIHEDHGIMTDDEDRANARLIAAAPELLAELERSLIEIVTLIDREKLRGIEHAQTNPSDRERAYYIKKNLELLQEAKSKRVAIIAKAKGVQND